MAKLDSAKTKLDDISETKSKLVMENAKVVHEIKFPDPIDIRMFDSINWMLYILYTSPLT